MLTSIGASAQWVAPQLKVEGAKFDDVVGQKVFLYNKEAGGFLRGLGKDASPYWGTRAGVAVEGADTIRFQPALAANVAEGTSDNENTVWMDEWDNETYLVQFKVPRFGRWDELWCGLMDFGTVWSDRQSSLKNNVNFFWNIAKNDNGTISIKISPKTTQLAEPDLYASLIVKDVAGNDSIVPAIKREGGNRLGVDLANSDLLCFFEGYNDGAPLSYDWTIIPAEKLDSATLANFKAEGDRYTTALSLGAYINETKEAYAGIDIKAAEDVYANTASTTEELLAAKEAVKAAILAYQEQQATPDNPSDMSTVIENATFDVIGDFTGWKGTAFGAGGTTSTCAELYDKSSFHTYQDITGLPKGVYAVKVKGFYRAGSISNDWNTKDDPSVRHARLFAVSGEDSLTTAIPSLSAAASVESISGSTTTGDGLYVPNTMADFTAFKEAGKINDVIVIIPVLDGNLRIGVVKNAHIGTDWCIVDDFTLLYYGNSVEAYNSWRDQVIANLPAVDVLIPNEETLYTESYKTAYEEAIASAKAEEVPENMAAKIEAIQPAYDALAANIAAYKAYMAKANDVQNELANNTDLDATNDSVIYLADYFMDDSEPGEYYPNGGYEYITLEHNLTTEQLEAEVANLANWLSSAIRHGVTTGDLTSMLINPSFADGFTGWTNSEGKAPIGNVGGVDVCKNVEVYQNVVDITQTVKDVPAGIYSISVQAFERPSGNGNYDGTEAANVFIYMNEFQTPVMNITADAMPEADAQDKVNCLVGDGGGAWPNDYNFNGGWVPNSMDGASYAFAAGRYVNKCYGIVGDDGVMKIGLTSNGKKIPEWILWANFKLTFEGKSDEAMAAILASTVEQANAYLEEKGAEMTTPALTALNDAIAKADAAIDYESSYAALHTINTVLEAARANVDAYAAAQAAIDAMYTAMSEYESAASSETLEKATAAAVKADGVVDLATEELVALTEEVKNVTSLLENDGKYAAAEDLVIEGEASETNPIDVTDFIANADFSAGADDGSWTYTKNGGNGPKYDGAFDGAGFEFWNGSATELQFDIHQSLYKLPAGYYKLTAQLTNSLNGQAEGENGGRVHLYADVYKNYVDSTYSVPVEIQSEDANTSPDTYEVVFYVDAPAYGSWVVVGARTVGTMDARWTVGDTFTLSYLGTATPTNIEAVENVAEAVPVAFYSISGAPLAAPQKGINIVKMSDGSVKKVFVK